MKAFKTHLIPSNVEHKNMGLVCLLPTVRGSVVWLEGGITAPVFVNMAGSIDCPRIRRGVSIILLKTE